MKEMLKKLTAVLLIVFMALSVASCGAVQKTGSEATPEEIVESTGETGAAEETAAAEETTASGEATTAQEEKTPEYPAFDFGGRTIKVGIWWDYYYTSAHQKITDDPNLGNTETAQMKLDNVRRVEKKYNCRIEYVNLGWDGIISSINTSIAAGNPECDIYLSDLQFGIPAVVNGLAQDLKAIAPEYCDLFTTKKVVKPLEALGGTYLFTEQGLPTNGIYIGYNATMIEELGLEDPQQLYKKGQWTWEKFAEYALKGTRDLDNDKTIDVYGYGGVFTDLVDGLIMNNGACIAAKETEGLSSKETVEVFEFINRLYNVDKSARPWNGEDWNDNLLAWSDGKVMFWTAQAWLLKQEVDTARAEGAELPFKYRVVPYPQGPSGDGKVYSPVIGNWYFIPVGVKEPEKVIQVFEEFLNWYNWDAELRDDPTWFESCFQTMEDVEIAYECGRNLKLDPWKSLSGFDFGGTIWWPIVVNKDTTVAQAVEAAKPVLQDALNQMWKK